MSGIISISIDEGTITSNDNETFQESLIEELFGAQQFSGAGSVKKINISTPKHSRKQQQDSSDQTSRSSGSRRSRKSSSSSKRLYLDTAGRRSAALGQAQTKVKMQPIAEDVDKLVREDVRKMIAKIRSSTQQRAYGLASDTKSASSGGSDKLLVRPGKYGEADMRVAKARRELVRKSRKDKEEKAKKRKESPVKARQPDKSSREGSRAGSSNGPSRATTAPTGNKVRKEARDQPEQATKSPEKFEPKRSTKEGYYKSNTESEPDQMIMMSVDAGAKKMLASTHAQRGHGNNDDLSTNPAAAKNEDVLAAGNVLQTVVSDLTKEEATIKSEDAPRDQETTGDQGGSSPNSDEGESEGIEIELEEDSDDSDTESVQEEHILSMPKIEKIKEADDFEPIECVLATPEDILEEERILQRQIGPKPDPSGSSNDDQDATIAASEAYGFPSFAERKERFEQPGLKPDPSMIKPDPAEAVKDLKQVVSANEASTAPDVQSVAPATRQAVVPATRQAVVAASLSHNETDTKSNPTDETDAHREKNGTSTEEEDVLRESTFTGAYTTTDCDDVTSTAGTTTDGTATVELVLVSDTDKVERLQAQNAKLKDTLLFLQRTAVEKEKYFAELAWFGKRSEEEVKKWRPNFWREQHAEFGPEVFEEFRADAMRIADPDVGDWEHGFSSGALAMARLLLGLSHAVDDEKICAFHDPGQKCTAHCITSTVAEQRERELADFPVLDP